MKRMAGLAVAAAGIAGILLGRRAALRWGATDEEYVDPLPGDELIPRPDLTATRAVTVHAPAEAVWPWLAQLGQGRGGLYSYDVLENLVGCDIHSADRVVPEWQDVEPGDEFKLHPDVALCVASVEPERALVIRGGVQMGETAPPYDFTWAFTLRELSAEETRLVVRERYGYARRWAPLLVEPVSVVSFVMTRKMLQGIRDRVERQMTERHSHGV